MLVAATVIAAVAARRGDLRAVIPVLVAAVAVFVVGLLFTWATNPLARLDMVQWLRDSIDLARNFPSQSTIRTAGRDLHANDLPWWYVPSWLGVQLPLLTLVAVVGGIGVVVARVRRLPLMPLVPVAVQAVGLPILIVASGAVLYDGIRHLLFMLPALIAIPALAFALLDRGRWRVALPVAAVVVVAASFASAVAWSPYAYAYLNPIGSIGPGEPWALDYWGVSAKEASSDCSAPGSTRSMSSRRSGGCAVGCLQHLRRALAPVGALHLHARGRPDRLRVPGALHDRARRSRPRRGRALLRCVAARELPGRDASSSTQRTIRSPRTAPASTRRRCCRRRSGAGCCRGTSGSA